MSGIPRKPSTKDCRGPSWCVLSLQVKEALKFKPGQKNEILIAVQDWLVYSPKNRDRVARGEEPIFKDAMVDCCGYPGAGTIGRPVRRSARLSAFISAGW